MKNLTHYSIGILAIVAMITALTAAGKVSQPADASDRIIDRGEIRIGYIIYPPLLSKDGVTGELSGISYDLVEAAAAKLNLQTDWREEVGWGSALEGLKTGRYDLVGTQMWPNSARAREAVFSIAPMNSVIYPYVRTGDHRFDSDLSKLNADEFTISTLDGEMSAFIAREDFPNATVNALPQLSSYAQLFLNVIDGKADVTFAEPSTANAFLQANPGSIVRIGGVASVRTFGNTFVFARGNNSMAAMWNVALGELMNEGMVTRTLEKYGVTEDYQINQ